MIKERPKKNKASFLILPMLGPDQSYFDWSGLLVNCYIQDANYPEYNNHIVLLLNYPEYLNDNNLGKIVSMENKLYRDLDHLLVKRYEPDVHHSIFIYNVPREYQDDYDWFMYSRYSKMSPKYKNKVVDFHVGSPTKGIIGVLSRNDHMLRNVHKNLGCLAIECKCASNTYLRCKHFSDYPFDFNKAEVWGNIGEEEILNINIENHRRIKIE
jgi:hypothetical protein